MILLSSMVIFFLPLQNRFLTVCERKNISKVETTCIYGQMANNFEFLVSNFMSLQHTEMSFIRIQYSIYELYVHKWMAHKSTIMELKWNYAFKNIWFGKEATCSVQYMKKRESNESLTRTHWEGETEIEGEELTGQLRKFLMQSNTYFVLWKHFCALVTDSIFIF